MLHTFAVVLMYAIPKFLTRSQGLIGCHPELRMRLAEPDILTGFKIVIPTSGCTSFHGKVEPLICFGEFLFRSFALGGIAIDADHSRRLPRLVHKYLPPCSYPMHASVRPNHAPFAPRGLSGFQRPIN